MARQPFHAAVLGVVAGALLTGVALPSAVEPSAPRRTAGAAPAAEVDAGVSGETSTTLAGIGTAPTASGVGGGTSVAAGAPVRAAADTSTAPTATAIGVTAERVRIGVLLFDLAGVGRLGFGAPGADAPQQRRFYEAFAADVNEAGGVGGRQLELVFESFDPTSRDDQRRACLAITEDARPFAVLSAGGFFGDPVLCVTEEHHTPLISGQGEADEYYARSRGLLFTPEMSASRMARTMARRAHAQGRLRGATIGVITSEEPFNRLPAERALLPELRRMGYDVAHVTTLSQDPSTASSQMPVEISTMQRKGVDTVLVSANSVLVALWFNQAEGQMFRPRYVLSDIHSAANDFTVQSAPSNLQAIAYTVMRQGESRVDRPQQPEAAACQARFRKRTGQLVERGTAGYDQMTAVCGTMETLVRALRPLGPAVTRAGFVGGLQRLGSVAFPDIGGTISFGPAKFDGADHVRTKRYVGSCRCWHPVDDFTPA